MTAIIFRELKDNRKGLLIWVVAMLGLVAIAAGEYPVVVESGDAIMALFETIPRIMLIAFGMVGMETIPINSPLGYYLGMYVVFPCGFYPCGGFGNNYNRQGRTKQNSRVYFYKAVSP